MCKSLHHSKDFVSVLLSPCGEIRSESILQAIFLLTHCELFNTRVHNSVEKEESSDVTFLLAIACTSCTRKGATSFV